MSACNGCQGASRFRQALPRCTGHYTELVVASRHEAGRSEGPALPALRVPAFDSPAADIGEVNYTAPIHHAGGSFPVPVPVDPEAVAEKAMTRLFHRLIKAVPLFLEFLLPVV